MTDNVPEVRQDASPDISSGGTHERSGSTESIARHRARLVQTVSTNYIGPLPPPDMLEHYGRIQPGLVERILCMTEDEARHRRDLEQRLIRDMSAEKRRGQWLGCGVALAALGVSVFALWQGHEWAAAAIGTTTVIGLASVFVLERLQRQPAVENDGD